MLNVTTIVLAVALLPAPFATVRIVAGIVVTVLVTYVVAVAGRGRVGRRVQAALRQRGQAVGGLATSRTRQM
jgi:hypothetical protein